MGKMKRGVQILPTGTQFMGPVDKDTPPKHSLSATKWRARIKPVWGIFVRGLFSPVVNAGAFFGLLTIPFSLFVISAFLGDKGLTSRIDNMGATMLSTIAALPIWAVINLLIAPFKAYAKEMELGSWNGARFVYREAQLVLTREWRPADNGMFMPVPVPVDAGLLVDYRIDVDGPTERINCVVLGAYFFRPLDDILRSVRFDRRGRAVVKKDGTVGLHCYSLPDSLPALIRVYVLAFENDPGILMDYTDLRTQTRMVLAPPDMVAAQEPVENRDSPTKAAGGTKEQNSTEKSVGVSTNGAP
jgi:hypothetical protein